jgi:predicted metalloprotease
MATSSVGGSTRRTIMKWKDRPESENVEDRRSFRKAGLVLGGGGSILIVILGLIFGFDPRPLLNQQGQPGAGPDNGQVTDPAQEELKKFASVVLKDTEDVWTEQFRTVYRSAYRKPKLVLFTGQVDSACGEATSAVGPFYCPGDQQVYLDLSFFQQLRKLMEVRPNAPIEFAQAYVIAHEVGHHVQKLLGYSEMVRTRKGELSDSVRLELQADYLAGAWAHHAQQTKNFLEEGDIEAALTAANAIGDDRLQKRARGTVVKDSFTHGTSAQRVRSFRDGFKTGDCSKGRLDRFFTSDEL